MGYPDSRPNRVINHYLDNHQINIPLNLFQVRVCSRCQVKEEYNQCQAQECSQCQAQECSQCQAQECSLFQDSQECSLFQDSQECHLIPLDLQVIPVRDMDISHISRESSLFPVNQECRLTHTGLPVCSRCQECNLTHM